MKKRLSIVLLLVLAVLLTGCGQGDKVVPLTEAELEYFNGTEFFNNYENRSNQFLGSLYDSPEQINMYELLYCDTGVREEITDKEIFTAYAVLIGEEYNEDVDIPCGCDKMTTAKIDEFLQKYTGLTLAETDKIGLDYFINLEEYDAYYHFHGDTNWTDVVFTKGERQGDMIRLYYDGAFYKNDGTLDKHGESVVTLRQTEEGYQFVSNQLV